MKASVKLLIGSVAAAGALYGARAWLRSRRRIDLGGRVVLITGASSGLGLVMSRQAAREGAYLAIAARDAGDLAAAERELRAAGAVNVLAVPTDVTRRDEVHAMIARVVARFGRIDVLVNNAGTIVVGPFEAMGLNDYEHAMATNFWGAVYASLAAIPYMTRQEFGRIVNIGSIGSKIAAPHLLPYTASKHALGGFSEGLRAELAHRNVLVTSAYPGLMHTGGHAHALIKGDHEAEYSWFGASDTVPGLAVSPELAAARIWEAAKVGDPSMTIGWSARLALAFQKLLPDWFAEAMALVNEALPKASGVGGPALRGEQLQGLVPDMLNRAIPPVTRPGTA